MDGIDIAQDSPRTEKLKILFVEDNPIDLELILCTLERANVDVAADIARTKAEFVDLLLASPHHAVVSDYRLNGWTGIEALELTRAHRADLPFILVTGALGEEAAVECFKLGISDYILKDRLVRLPVAIVRSIGVADLLRERTRVAQRLRDSESMFQTLAEEIDTAIFVYNGPRCVYANHEAELVTGYTRQELLLVNSLTLIDASSRDDVIKMGFRNLGAEDFARHREVKITTKTGDTKWISMRSRAIELDGKLGRLLTAYDITKQKATEHEMLRLAVTDPLTGLANYRRLIDAFDSELARSRRNGTSFSLMLLDLDGLKKINDVYGHAVGSRALSRVGHILQTQCRNVDVAARYGGDEFAVILPETTVPEAKHLAHRVAKAVEDDSEKPQLSISFGLAACPDDGESFKEVLRIADGGLYFLKGQKFTSA